MILYGHGGLRPPRAAEGNPQTHIHRLRHRAARLAGNLVLLWKDTIT